MARDTIVAQKKIFLFNYPNPELSTIDNVKPQRCYFGS